MEAGGGIRVGGLVARVVCLWLGCLRVSRVEDRESTVCSNLKEKVRNKVVCRGREPGERGVLEGVPSL